MIVCKIMNLASKESSWENLTNFSVNNAYRASYISFYEHIPGGDDEIVTLARAHAHFTISSLL